MVPDQPNSPSCGALGLSAAVSTVPARALRRGMVRDRYNVSLSTIDRLAKEGKIRSKKVGRALLLNAEDCEKAFGWPEPAKVEPSARSMAEMRELVG